ncbi:hypothetical protein KSP40_PGU021274 [Platanthera guangdongensis]|uniref:Uncharacterized protein n=1 Tax=Platanthera guangdongensis TaxID=2320717 RepID=A0ABR2MPF6_9ASPA
MFLRRIMMGGMWSILMMKVKEMVGIVGLEVLPNRQVVLIPLYKQTLTEINAVPKEEGYHKAMKSFANHPLRARDDGIEVNDVLRSNYY